MLLGNAQGVVYVFLNTGVGNPFLLGLVPVTGVFAVGSPIQQCNAAEADDVDERCSRRLRPAYIRSCRACGRIPSRSGTPRGCGGISPKPSRRRGPSGLSASRRACCALRCGTGCRARRTVRACRPSFPSADRHRGWWFRSMQLRLDRRDFGALGNDLFGQVRVVLGDALRIFQGSTIFVQHLLRAVVDLDRFSLAPPLRPCRRPTVARADCREAWCRRHTRALSASAPSERPRADR